MEFSFKTFTEAAIIASDFGLDVVRVLFEHIWLGSLGLCLLICVLKLPNMLTLALILFLVCGVMWFMVVS